MNKARTTHFINLVLLQLSPTPAVTFNFLGVELPFGQESNLGRKKSTRAYGPSIEQLTIWTGFSIF